MVESIKELRKICQPKPKAKEFLYTKYMRRVSIYFTKPMLMLGASANQITFLQILLMLSSLFPLLFYGSWYFVILSAVLLNISYLFDHVDGEIARYMGSTYYGRMLDIIGHDLFYIIFLFLGFGAYYRFGDIIYIMLGISATTSLMILRLHQMRFEYINIEVKVRKKSGKIVKGMYKIMMANGFLPIMYILALLDLIQYFLYFYGIYIPVFWFIWLVRNRKWFNVREKKGSDEKVFWDAMLDRV